MKKILLVPLCFWINDLNKKFAILAPVVKFWLRIWVILIVTNYVQFNKNGTPYNKSYTWPFEWSYFLPFFLCLVLPLIDYSILLEHLVPIPKNNGYICRDRHVYHFDQKLESRKCVAFLNNVKKFFLKIFKNCLIKRFKLCY